MDGDGVARGGTPATGAATAAAGQVQVSVEAALAALAGTGVDAVSEPDGAPDDRQARQRGRSGPPSRADVSAIGTAGPRAVVDARYAFSYGA